MAPLTVAIAGASGRLGKPITRTLLSPTWHPERVGRVIILSREAASPTINELKDIGAEVIEGPVTADSLRGVDVLVNTISVLGSSLEELNTYGAAAVEAGVKAYFPSEFGIWSNKDPRIDVSHPLMVTKRAHEEYVRELAGDKMKIVCIDCGIYYEAFQVMGAYFGFDWHNRKFTTVGDPDAKFSATSIVNIAAAVVRLAIVVVEDPQLVPDDVLIAGDSITMADFASLFTEETGQQYTTASIDPTEFKETLQHHKWVDIIKYLVGKGVAYSPQNANQLVNPDESFWKWRLFADFVRESRGALWN